MSTEYDFSGPQDMASLQESWQKCAVNPATQMQHDVAMNDPSFNQTLNNVLDQKFPAINAPDTVVDCVDMASLNLQATPACSTILGDCVDQMNKLGNECSAVVKPQLQNVQVEQVAEMNKPAVSDPNQIIQKQYTPVDPAMTPSGPMGG